MDSSSAYNTYMVKKKIDDLKGKKGWGTELISLYIPPDRNLSEVTSYLKSELSQASNIKDKITNKNVRACLRTIIQRIKTISKSPENGLAIFCGAIPKMNLRGTEKIELTLLVPPYPLKTFMYRCGDTFDLSPLEKMLAVEGSYGFLLIDHKEAVVAILRGMNLQVIKKYTSGAPGKHSAGGQSQRRFERLREKIIKEYYVRVASHATNIFRGIKDLAGIIIGGPGYAKEEFLEEGGLPQDIREKIIGVVDTGYSGETGLRELVERSEGILKDLDYIKEKKLVKEFMRKVVEEPGSVTYGEREVISCLKQRAVDTLILSEGLDKVRFTVKCFECGEPFNETVEKRDVVKFKENILERKCPNCGASNLQAIEEKYLLDELVEMGEKYGVNIRIISTNTEEGQEFLSAFGGFAATLKFPCQTQEET